MKLKIVQSNQVEDWLRKLIRTSLFSLIIQTKSDLWALIQSYKTD